MTTATQPPPPTPTPKKNLISTPPPTLNSKHSQQTARSVNVRQGLIYYNISCLNCSPLPAGSFECQPAQLGPRRDPIASFPLASFV